jgi:NADH-ubiquinone oxidoreductase chain 5
LTKDMIIGVGTDFWGNALFVLPSNLIIFEAEFLPHSIKIIPVIFSLSGTFLAYILYYHLNIKTIYNLKMSKLGIFFYNFFNRKWYIDKVYNESINQFVLYLGYNGTYKVIDRGFIEFFGPFGLSSLFYNKLFNILRIQTGLIYHYTFIMLISIVFLLTFIGLNSFIFYFVDFHLFILFIFTICLFFVNKKGA